MTALGERRTELQMAEFGVHSFPGYYIVVEGTGATGKETISLNICHSHEGGNPKIYAIDS